MFALGLLALLCTGTVAEPPGIATLVKASEKGAVDNALEAAGLTQRCKGALQKTGVEGLYCRLAVVEALADRTLATAADVARRAGLAKDGLAAAQYLAATIPTKPEPGLRRTRFQAHQRACNIAFAALSDFEALPVGHFAAAQAKTLLNSVPTAVPTAVPPLLGLRDNACACANRSIDLGFAAEATPQEQAAAQGARTTNRCALAAQTPPVIDRRDPSKAFATGDIALRSVADASSPAGRLAEMARGRAVEFSRCTDKSVSVGGLGNTVDVPKLSLCVCAVVKRWSLPLKKDDPGVHARLPLMAGDSLYVPVTIERNTVTACGDVEGPMLETKPPRPTP